MIKQIKEAFPFLFCKRIGGVIHYPWEIEAGILKVNIYVVIKVHRIINVDLKFKE